MQRGSATLVGLIEIMTPSLVRLIVPVPELLDVSVKVNLSVSLFTIVAGPLPWGAQPWPSV